MVRNAVRTRRWSCGGVSPASSAAARAASRRGGGGHTLNATTPRPAAPPGPAARGRRRPARRRPSGRRRTACCPSRTPGSPSRTNDQWSLDRCPDSATVGTPARSAARSSSARSGSPSSDAADRHHGADADPVQGHHAAQRPALRGRQRGDVRPRAVVVVVVGRPARLLGAERDEHDREPGAPAGDRLGDREQGADPRGVVLGARRGRHRVEVRADGEPRLAGHHVAAGRDHVDRVAGLDRESLGRSGHRRTRPAPGRTGAPPASRARSAGPRPSPRPRSTPAWCRGAGRSRRRGGAPRPSRWPPGRRRGRRARAPAPAGCRGCRSGRSSARPSAGVGGRRRRRGGLRAAGSLAVQPASSTATAPRTPPPGPLARLDRNPRKEIPRVREHRADAVALSL